MTDSSKIYEGLVDFHCHLDLYPNHLDLVKECENLGIKTLTVTNAPRVWLRNHKLVKDCKHVRAALGLHPQLAHLRETELVLFEQYISQSRYIGEVGLDGSQEYIGTFDVQRRVFTKILELCKEQKNKILTIHSRRAVSEVLTLLKQLQFLESGKAVLHWFTGNLNEARQALDLGLYFSINDPMITSISGRKLLKFLPIERILTESDGPFIRYENSPITPKDIIKTVRKIAAEHHLSDDTLKHKIIDNLKSILSHPNLD